MVKKIGSNPRTVTSPPGIPGKDSTINLSTKNKHQRGHNMASKKELKEKTHKKIDEIIDGIEKVDDINFFEIIVKCTNGKLSYKKRNTYIDE